MRWLSLGTASPPLQSATVRSYGRAHSGAGENRPADVTQKRLDSNHKIFSRLSALYSHTAVIVGNVNLQKTSLISLGGSRILLSSHQFNTSTNVEATYAETISGGICRVDCFPNRKSFFTVSAMTSVSTLRRWSCRIALPLAPILSPQACACR